MELKFFAILALVLIVAAAGIWHILVKPITPTEEGVPPSEEVPEETPPTEEVPETIPNEILIYSDYYEPSQIKIKTGEEVTWTNKDNKSHLLVLENPPVEKTIFAGQSFSFPFYETGTVQFWDPDVGQDVMNGQITVE